MIDANIELVRMRTIDRRRCIDVGAGYVRIRNQGYDVRRDRVPSIARNNPLPGRIASEFWPSRTEGIDHRSIEDSRLILCGRHDSGVRDSFPFSEALVVREPKCAIADERTADRHSELV